jgi:hypothetical protein
MVKLVLFCVLCSLDRAAGFLLSNKAAAHREVCGSLVIGALPPECLRNRTAYSHRVHNRERQRKSNYRVLNLYRKAAFFCTDRGCILRRTMFCQVRDLSLE